MLTIVSIKWRTKTARRGLLCYVGNNVSWKFGANIAVFQKLILSFWKDAPPILDFVFAAILKQKQLG